MQDRLLLIHDPGDPTGTLEALLSEAGLSAVPLEQIAEPCLQQACQQDGRCVLLELPGLAEVHRLVAIIREMPETLRPYLILITSQTDQAHVAPFIDAGVDDLIAQPISELEFRIRLQPAHRFLQLQQAFRTQALHDPLTGTLNRAAVVESLERELKRARRYGYPVAVVMADLDGLKQINDSHGHQAGDVALTATARRMSAQLRPYDAIGRYGGDEFLLTLGNCAGPQAMVICQRIRQAVCAPSIAGQSITISLGITIADPKSATPPSALIQQADAALYQAKRTGRNRVVSAI